MLKTAFIGLGNMGLPMARNLVAAGYKVTGFDLSQDACEALAGSGGEIAATVTDAVTGAELVVTMLPAGQHVESVYTGEGGVLATASSDTLLIDCSTIDVETARRVAAAAQQAGFDMVDAPVSGGVGGAESAGLTFMTGGTEQAFERAKPVLANMGKNIFHAGRAGNGQVAKICNNMLLGISMIGTCEAFLLAENLGLDGQTLFDIASTASGQCWSMTSYCPVPGPVPTSPANRDYQPGFAAAMMLKDLHLAEAAAQSASSATPLGNASARLYEKMAETGMSGTDFSGIINMLRDK